MAMKMNRLHLKRMPLRALAALAAAAVLAVSCSGSGSPTSPSGSSNLRLLLTDDPIDDVTEVNIYFTSVTVKPVGGPVEHNLPLVLDPNPVNLLDLADDTTGFASGFVPAGDYEFIHVNIDPVLSNIVENGVEKPLQVPSKEIKIVGGFNVDASQLTTLTLDFDAAASLVLLGNGQWLLKPVVVITGNNTSSQP